MDDSAEFYKESMTKEDYIDVVRILDYTPESFLLKNRKRYDQWKIIGMAVTRRGFGTGDVKNTDEYSDPTDPLARGLVGLASGCLVLEEINQHNHLVSRGADFLRVKIDGSGSATYGVMGNCKNPDKGLNATSIGPQYAGGFPPDDGQQPLPNSQDLILPNYFLKYSPWMNGWADSMDSNLCSCAGVDEKSWQMYVLGEIDDVKGTKRFLQTAGSTQKSTIGVNDQTIRTCDFISYPSGPEAQAGLLAESRASDICVDYTNKMFNLARGGLTGSVILALNHGVIVRLTSYPSCNQRKLIKLRIPQGGFGSDELNKEEICYNPDDSQYNPEEPFCFTRIYPERAVLRIMPVCMAKGSVSTQEIYKINFFNHIEKHYDRWDKAKEGFFKIFDEVFDFPDAKMKIRIITHKPEEFDKYYFSLFKDDRVTFKNPADYMKPYFLTGGNINDRAGGAKGCSCTNEAQNESHYPIRPYNQFVYCPNNFTGEKTCS
jgi:hypothetical protein